MSVADSKRFLGPLALVTAAASGLTFWATNIWWVLPLGLAASGVILAQGLLGRGRPVEAAPDEPWDALSSEAREKLRALQDQAERVRNELTQRGAELFDRGEIGARVEEVVTAYRTLLLRLQDVTPLLDAHAAGPRNAAIQQLEARIATCTDDVTRENLRRTLANRTDERDRLAQLERYKGQIESQLLSLASALNSLRLRIAQSRLSVDESLDPTKGIQESLDGVFHEVEVAERTAAELGKMVQQTSAAASRSVA